MTLHNRLAARAAIGVAALICGLLAPAAPVWAAVSQAQLVARSQALLDAVGSGDKAVWAATLAEDGVFTDEEGQVRTKAQAVSQISGLPPGYVGSIRIASPKMTASGDIAVLTYDALETLTLYGQTLHTHYHTTDVYRTGGRDLQLIASQTSVLPAEARPLGRPSPLTDFVGDYGLGPKDRVHLSVEGSSLVAIRNGAREVLVALGGDWFARPGRPRGQRIFVRDSAGRVTGFSDRRDNVDLMWSRL